MITMLQKLSWLVVLLSLGSGFLLNAQNSTNTARQNDNPPPMDGGGPGMMPPGGGPPPDFGGPPPFMGGPGGPGGGGRGPGGFGGMGGPGGFGGMQQETKLLKQFDKDGDNRLNAEERKAAREYLAQQKKEGRGNRFMGPPRWGRNDQQTVTNAPIKLKPSDVKTYSEESLYDMGTLRTLFIDFEDADWEKEMVEFYHSDVEVPAKLTVDGKVYNDIGIHFRGASSFFMVSDGKKRSLNISIDFVHADQRLNGYRSLHLLNSHTDPTYLHSVLTYKISRDFIPAPKANFVRLVINGESWGVYVNVQPFNKEFTKEWFASAKGARFKAPGSPQGNSGLAYVGEDPAAYKRLYQLSTKEDPKAWTALIQLCRVLNKTPADQLEAALAPLLDIDGALKFLALQNILINNDGFWCRASDYCLYLDEKGRFHVVPHDDNETFGRPEGPGMGWGQQVNGVELDPFAGAKDANKALLNKLLSVPALRTRYLGFVKNITEQWLDWSKLEPVARDCQKLIAEDVKTDIHKLDSYDSFINGLAVDSTESGGFRGPRQSISIKSFVEQRRQFLLNYTGIKDPTTGSK